MQQEGLNVSYRNISLSTCGIVPNIYKFSEENIPSTLCLSLHSAFEEKRNVIMPISKKYSLSDTLEAMKFYEKKSGRRLIFEYLLIVNLTTDMRTRLSSKGYLGE